MTDHTPSPWAMLLAELATGAGLAHLFDGWPPVGAGGVAVTSGRGPTRRIR